VLARLLWLVAPPLCEGCRAHASGGAPVCPDCRSGLRWLGPESTHVEGLGVWSPLAYEGAARALVAGLKYRGAVGLAHTMAAQVVAAAPGGLLEHVVLVPVPLSARRQRRRGFNQAELLAAAIARRTGLRVSDCLERAGTARPQVGRDRSERLAAIGATIAVGSGARPPSRALLVDDVLTTGATLGACATALRAAGSRTIAGVVYARTPGR